MVAVGNCVVAADMGVLLDFLGLARTKVDAR